MAITCISIMNVYMQNNSNNNIFFTKISEIKKVLMKKKKKEIVQNINFYNIFKNQQNKEPVNLNSLSEVNLYVMFL